MIQAIIIQMFIETFYWIRTGLITISILVTISARYFFSRREHTLICGYVFSGVRFLLGAISHETSLQGEDPSRCKN